MFERRIIYLVCVLVVMLVGCKTPPTSPNTPNTSQVTVSNVTLKVEFPRTIHPEENAQMLISIDNSSTKIVVFWPAFFEVRVRGPKGLLVPVLGSFDVRFIGHEDSEFGAEDETTIGKRMEILRPDQSLHIPISIQESYRFTPGHYRIEVSGGCYWRPSADYTREEGVLLVPKPLEFDFESPAERDEPSK